jgi:hypothetical protein
VGTVKKTFDGSVVDSSYQQYRFEGEDMLEEDFTGAFVQKRNAKKAAAAWADKASHLPTNLEILKY